MKNLQPGQGFFSVTLTMARAGVFVKARRKKSLYLPGEAEAGMFPLLSHWQCRLKWVKTRYREKRGNSIFAQNFPVEMLLLSIVAIEAISHPRNGQNEARVSRVWLDF